MKFSWAFISRAFISRYSGATQAVISHYPWLNDTSLGGLTAHCLEAGGDHDAAVASVACRALFEHRRRVVAVAAKGLPAEAAGVSGQLRLHLGLVRFGVGATELLVGRFLLTF